MMATDVSRWQKFQISVNASHILDNLYINILVIVTISHIFSLISRASVSSVRLVCSPSFSVYSCCKDARN